MYTFLYAYYVIHLRAWRTIVSGGGPDKFKGETRAGGGEKIGKNIIRQAVGRKNRPQIYIYGGAVRADYFTIYRYRTDSFSIYIHKCRRRRRGWFTRRYYLFINNTCPKNADSVSVTFARQFVFSTRDNNYIESRTKEGRRFFSF